MPAWRLTKWLVKPGRNVPADIQVALLGGLFGSLPIFFGGIINTLMVAALITCAAPSRPSCCGWRWKRWSAPRASWC